MPPYTFNTPPFRSSSGTDTVEGRLSTFAADLADAVSGASKRRTFGPASIESLETDLEVEFREKVEIYREKFSPPGPVETLIVEQPLQRYDNPMPPDTSLKGHSGDFVRELPVEATPNVVMPDGLQGSSNIQYQPVLDLFRYKTNRYWNQLRFDGKFNSRRSLSQQEFVGPIDWIEFPSTVIDSTTFVQGDDKFKYIAGPLDTHGSNRRTVNPFSKLLKEIITITANPIVFGDTAKEGFSHTDEGLIFNDNIPEGLTTDPNAADAADISVGFASTILRKY